jgi:predicted lipoprotein with Yx(FWY)xxD motif
MSIQEGQMRRFLPVALAITAALLVAGCGSSDSSSDSGKSSGGGYGSPSDSGASRAAKSQTGAIAVRNGSLGTYLVDGQGRALYLFEADKGRTSTCSGACAQAWPPVPAKAKPQGAKGVQADLLGTSRRADGASQVTYDGHPLYRYAGDRAAGDTAGQGLDQFGAEWYLVKPDGSTLED